LKPDSQWNEIKNIFRGDPRYGAVKSASQRENLFEEFMMQEVLTLPGQKRDRLVARN